MTEAHLAFGKTGIRLALPPGPRYFVAQTVSAAPLSHPEDAIEAALNHPVAGPSLRELAKGKRSAAIAVCDITRPAPNQTTLPLLLRHLHDGGIAREDITILIATGLHRAATEAETQRIVGSEIAAHYRILNHDARDRAQHRWLGTTHRGTPVAIDERFMQADLHITVGLIEPHLMLGFSGGRKLIAPGVAAQETIKVIHSPRFMREPLATEGETDRNPLHDELTEIAAMAKHDFMLDVTLTTSREISGVFAGTPVEAHAAGVAFLHKTSVLRLPELADLVITSAAGYPLDLTFYQAIKGVTAAQHICKPGGRILVVAECSEGVGSQEFAGKLEAYAGPQSYLDEIQHGTVEVDQWQLEKLAMVGLRHEVFFFTPGVTARQLGALGERHYPDLEAAFAAATAGLGTDASVVIVPDGPYTWARV